MREVYMKELHIASSSSPKVYKLEGEGVSVLRTGQWVRVEGHEQAAGGVAAAASGGAPAAPLMTVSSIAVEQQPNYKKREVITSSSSGNSQRSAAVDARGVLEPMVGAAASAVLSREQLTLEATVVSTLVLPLSLEGCPKPGGGTYGAPWYSQQVRPSARQLTALCLSCLCSFFCCCRCCCRCCCCCCRCCCLCSFFCRCRRRRAWPLLLPQVLTPQPFCCCWWCCCRMWRRLCFREAPPTQAGPRWPAYSTHAATTSRRSRAPTHAWRPSSACPALASPAWGRPLTAACAAMTILWGGVRRRWTS